MAFGTKWVKDAEAARRAADSRIVEEPSDFGDVAPVASRVASASPAAAGPSDSAQHRRPSGGFRPPGSSPGRPASGGHAASTPSGGTGASGYRGQGHGSSGGAYRTARAQDGGAAPTWQKGPSPSEYSVSAALRVLVELSVHEQWSESRLAEMEALARVAPSQAMEDVRDDWARVQKQRQAALASGDTFVVIQADGTKFRPIERLPEAVRPILSGQTLVHLTEAQSPFPIGLAKQLKAVPAQAGPAPAPVEASATPSAVQRPAAPAPASAPLPSPASSPAPSSSEAATPAGGTANRFRRNPVRP